MKTKKQIERKIESINNRYIRDYGENINERNTAYTREYDWGYYQALKWILK